MPTREKPSHAFPETQWSRILAGARPADLEALARAYWRPIQAYLAARLRLDADASAELAQEAFAWMLETRLVERADPARGRFRGLLKTALARFAVEHLEKANAQKRGGGRVHETIDAGRDLVDLRSPPPEEALDDAWRRELIERARALLEAELQAGGRPRYWLVFRDYFLDEEKEELGHAALAARYGVARSDVSNWLDHAKRRFREILHGLVVETVGSEPELREELEWLFGAPRAKGAAKS